MSDLPVCRLCGMHPVFVAENVLFHEHNPDQPCPLTTDHFSVAQWNALMDVPGGEVAAVVKEWNANGSGHCFSVEWIVEPRDGMSLYTHPAPAVESVRAGNPDLFWIGDDPEHGSFSDTDDLAEDVAADMLPGDTETIVSVASAIELPVRRMRVWLEPCGYDEDYVTKWEWVE